MVCAGSYRVTDEFGMEEIGETNKHNSRMNGLEERAYLYEEAIDLTGNGRYNRGLLVTLIIVTIAMAVDLFGYSVVVAGSVCDLELDHKQTSIAVSLPFIGPIVMSYVWGYISDTQGRRKSLIISMYGSFILGVACAFSPHWIVMTVLKLLGASFSTCAQSVTYPLLSESCSERVRGSYMLIMTSLLLLSPCTFYVIGYIVLSFDFSLDMGYISFTPWRLLALVLCLPLGMGATILSFYYESPKFLVNAGHEQEALNVLSKIYKCNGGKGSYPVKRLILNEEGVRTKGVPILKSLWQQTAPLFKPPLLFRTVQLYYLIAVVYSTNNSFMMWFPFLVNKFFDGFNTPSDDNEAQGLCELIVMPGVSSNHSDTGEMTCKSSLQLQTALASMAQSILCTIINLCFTRFASRKKTLMITILMLTLGSCIGTISIHNNVVSFVMFIGVFFTNLCIGFVFSYFIELYPTSHRGMATCLAVMVARASALGGINLVGAFVLSHCVYTFYGWAAYVFSGVVFSCFLPSDRQKKI